MTRAAHFLAALLLLPVAAACGGDSDYAPPAGGGPVIPDRNEQRLKQEAREKKEAGKRLEEGDGYWYVRPVEWRRQTRAYQDLIPFLDNAITETEDEGIYAELVWVTVIPAGSYLNQPFEDQIADFGRYLRARATGVQAYKMTEIDRKQAIHHSGMAKGGAIEARFDQYVVLSQTDLYTITFKLAVEHPLKERKRLIARVLDSWHWDT
jgi:hypothetical protein